MPAGAALGAAVLLAYFNSLAGAFQFDDYLVIVDNPVVHGWSSWLADLGRGIRPLLKLSYLLNWLAGWGAPGFHAVNILIHFGNTLLVYQLAKRFVRLSVLREETASLPLFAALLFAVHPVHTEAVTYICGRSSSLMTLFYLAGLLGHASCESRHRRLLQLAVVPGMFAAAVACKETAITFPLALMAWDLCSGLAIRESIRRQWPVWLLAALAAAVFIMHPSYRAMLITGSGLHSLTVNIYTTVAASFYLLGKWLWPVQLNIDPDLRPVAQVYDVLPQLFLLLALAGAVWKTGRKRLWLGLAVCWFFLHLLPLHLLAPRQDIANERQLYLAGFPIFIALAAETILILKKRGKAFLLGLLLVLAALTVMRNNVYKTEISLWEDTVKWSAGKPRVRNNLGYAYMLAGRKDEARREFLAALAIDPDFKLARNNLSELLKK